MTSEIKQEPFKPKHVGPCDYWLSLGIEDSNTSCSEAIHLGFTVDVYKKVTNRIGLTQKEFLNATRISIGTLKRGGKSKDQFSLQESDAI